MSSFFVLELDLRGGLMKDKKPSLKETIADINKEYGIGSIMQMSEDKYDKTEGIPTGVLSLDIALGGFGIPKGRIVEFFGPESSGKTTLALSVIANSQKAGGVAALIDAEHAFDTTWAKKLGVNVNDILVSQPNSGEEALNIVEMLVKSNNIDIIVVDSVAALTPLAELSGDMGQSHVGLQARLMSQALRKLTGIVSKSKSCIIFINQIRMKIGVLFGNPETTTGGNALKFYSSVRLDIRRIATIKDNESAIGNTVRAKVVKNKLAPPFREAEFDIMFKDGISYEGNLLDLGVAKNIIAKNGAWFLYGDTQLGQGRENAKKFLADNPLTVEEIKGKIK